MAKIMKIKCNGQEGHVNSVKLEELKKSTPVMRGAGRSPSSGVFPERSVLPCQHCSDGQVVITKAMIAEFYRKTGRV